MANSPALGDIIPEVSGIIKNVQDDVKQLVQGEVELAKSELIPSAKKAGIGAGLLGGAGYFGINGLTLLYVAAALGIYALGLPLWLSFLIVAVVLLLIAGLLALIGLANLKKVKGPDKTIAQAKESVASIKGAIQRGTAAAKAPQIEGQVVSNGSSDKPVSSRALR
jgi:membrane protein implicated in regulation of membrane protease activity